MTSFIFKILAIGLPLFLLASPFFMRWRMRRSAKKLLDRQKELFAGKQEYVLASLSEFPWMDHSFYARSEEALRLAGFRLLGDIEPLTASRQFPEMRTFLRILLSNTGEVSAAVYHIKARGFMGLLSIFRVVPRHMRIIELETEFVDGSFLLTNNTAGLNAFTNYKGIVVVLCEIRTPIAELLTSHYDGLRLHATNGGAPARRMNNLTDVLNSQERMDQIKAAQKKAQGFVTRDEFKQVAGGKLSRGQEQLVAEFERQARNEQES